MKKINFIEKLILENKISLVEPNPEISKSHLEKSYTNMRASKLLLENNLLEESVSMSYYSMYNKLLSLFYLIGLKCENHSVSIILLKELFSLDNSTISFVKQEMIDKQYYTDFKVTSEDAKDLIDKSNTFISELDMFIDSLTEEQRNKFRAEFEKTYF